MLAIWPGILGGIMTAFVIYLSLRGVTRYIHQSLATEVILGHRRRARWLPGDTTSEVIPRLSGVDVHILRSRVPD